MLPNRLFRHHAPWLLGAWLLGVFAQACCACPTATLAFLPPYSQINASLDASNKFGLEDGIVVRRADGGFQLIAAEMYDDPLWVRMRLGVWTSPDAVHWKKVRTVRQSSGNFDGTDPHSSSWGPFLVQDSSTDVWNLFYVGYRGAPTNGSGWLENYQGVIYGQAAGVPGDAGLDSDFGDDLDWRAHDRVLLAPDDFVVTGPWPHPCQGLQGTDSFYPYPLDDGTWAALVGTSHQELPNPWPSPAGGKWAVSLATSPSLYGPWTRHNPDPHGVPADAPCLDVNGEFIEVCIPVLPVLVSNPIAYHCLSSMLMCLKCTILNGLVCTLARSEPDCVPAARPGIHDGV